MGPCNNITINHKYFHFFTCSTASAKELLIYSYGRSFNGFAAKLSDEEVARFSGEIITHSEERMICTSATIFLFSGFFFFFLT